MQFGLHIYKIDVTKILKGISTYVHSSLKISSKWMSVYGRPVLYIFSFYGTSLQPVCIIHPSPTLESWPPCCCSGCPWCRRQLPCHLPPWELASPSPPSGRTRPSWRCPGYGKITSIRRMSYDVLCVMFRKAFLSADAHLQVCTSCSCLRCAQMEQIYQPWSRNMYVGFYEGCSPGP